MFVTRATHGTAGGNCELQWTSSSKPGLHGVKYLWEFAAKKAVVTSRVEDSRWRKWGEDREVVSSRYDIPSLLYASMNWIYTRLGKVEQRYLLVPCDLLGGKKQPMSDVKECGGGEIWGNGVNKHPAGVIMRGGEQQNLHPPKVDIFGCECREKSIVTHSYPNVREMGSVERGITAR